MTQVRQYGSINNENATSVDNGDEDVDRSSTRTDSTASDATRRRPENCSENEIPNGGTSAPDSKTSSYRSIDAEDEEGRRCTECSTAALCECFDGHCHELHECGWCLADCGRQTWTGARSVDCRGFLRRTFTVDTLKDKLPILKWLPKYRYTHTFVLLLATMATSFHDNLAFTLMVTKIYILHL